MASITVTSESVEVRFNAAEALFVLRRHLTIPLEAIRSASVVDRGTRSTRLGGRAGLVVSGLVKVGIWGLGSGVRQLVSVRAGQPNLLLAVDRAAAGARFDEVLLSTPDAIDLRDAMRLQRPKVSG